MDNEKLLYSALEELSKKQFESYDNFPEHKFSLKHRIAMKFILAKADRNARRYFRRLEKEKKQKHEKDGLKDK